MRPSAAPPYDLTQIHGIGPRTAAILNDGGITTLAELQHAKTAALSPPLIVARAFARVDRPVRDPLAAAAHALGGGYGAWSRRLAWLGNGRIMAAVG